MARKEFGPSPYTPGVPTARVFGREDLVRSAVATMGDAAAGHCSVRPCIFLGDPGVGTTSILLRLKVEAQGLGFVPVWVRAGGSEEGLVAQIHAATVGAVEALPAAAKQAVQGVLGQDAETDDGVGGEFSPQGVHEAMTSRVHEVVASGVHNVMTLGSGDAARWLQDFLEAVTTAVHGNGCAGLALFIDELHDADTAGCRALAYAVQGLQSDAPTLPLVIFAAGTDKGYHVLTDAAPFAERFAYEFVTKLSAADARKVLVEPALQCGVSWDEDAVDACVAAAAGSPARLQEIGHAVWQQAAWAQGPLLTAADVARVLPF